MNMSSKAVLITSVCLNAGLAVALVMSPKAPSPTVTKEVSTSSIVKPAGARKNSTGEQPVVVTNVVDLGFHWREVESADYKEYIAKLRGIGCPEVTIREIILADIDKLFEPRMVALRDLTGYQPEKFWLANNYSQRKRDPEKAAQMKALTEERAALIKELLGVEESDLRQALSAYEDPSKAAYAFLSPEQQDQMKTLNKKFNEERSKIYENANGFIDSETQAEVNNLRKKMLTEMKAFMTPEQIFEYDIRTSDTARNMKYNEARGLDLTEAEFRAMFAAKRAQEDARPTGDEKLTQEQMKANLEASKEAQEILKATLGEERYKEIEMTRDYGYRQLISAAPFLGFDKAAAARVSDLKTQAEKAAREIQRNQALSPEERTKALQDIRTASEAAVTKEIGEKGFKYYKRQGGYWLNNLSPRTVIRTTSP